MVCIAALFSVGLMVLSGLQIFLKHVPGLQLHIVQNGDVIWTILNRVQGDFAMLLIELSNLVQLQRGVDGVPGLLVGGDGNPGQQVLRLGFDR